ncbi:MAG: rod shape-determining protein MreD [Muribaculaceae bacterium]
MSKTILNFILLFLLLIPAQAVIFNNLILFNVAIPLVFIYLIIRLPMTVSVNAALTIGFITGLSVDIFSDTLGVNAMGCTLLAFVRRPVFHLYVSLDDQLGGQSPSISTMGSAAYMKYLITMTTFYCLTVFMIEAFQFFNLKMLVLRTVASSIFTFIAIYAIDSLSIRRRHEKKL